MADQTRRRFRSRQDVRRLIHELNQRYRAEFDRAERLQAELRDTQSSRAWRTLAWLRKVKVWLRRCLRPTVDVPDGWQHDGVVPLRPLIPVSTRKLKVSIIIPFRDQATLLRTCLRSLRGLTHRRYEIVLVDNGSTSVAMSRLLNRLRGNPRYEVVDAPGPFNFARLCNLGAQAANGDYLLFLNNDVESKHPEWLQRLVEVAEQPNVAVVGATLLYPDHTLQHVGLVRRGEQWVHPYRGEPAETTGVAGELGTIRSVPAVTAACMLISQRLFAEMHGFDERFPVTHNDVDLCERVRRRGLLIAITPHAQLWHYESLSRGYQRDGG